MKKLIIAISLFLFSISSVGFAFKGVVNNSIISSDRNFDGILTATVFLDNDRYKIVRTSGRQSELELSLDTHNLHLSNGRIVISAPFCDTYPGFSCYVTLPKHCFYRIAYADKLIISGVMTVYGLHVRTLKCFKEK